MPPADGPPLEKTWSDAGHEGTDQQPPCHGPLGGGRATRRERARGREQGVHVELCTPERDTELQLRPLPWIQRPRLGPTSLPPGPVPSFAYATEAAGSASSAYRPSNANITSGKNHGTYR